MEETWNLIKNLPLEQQREISAYLEATQNAEQDTIAVDSDYCIIRQLSSLDPDELLHGMRMYNETHARDSIWFTRRLKIINQLEEVAQKLTRVNSNSTFKNVCYFSAVFAATLMLKKLTGSQTCETALMVGGTIAFTGYHIYNRLSIDADLEELKRDLERDEKDLYEIENLMRELQDPLEKVNTFQPLLVKLFQVGADGFVEYMTSMYPSEEDVVNKASKKISQIFYDDNFTSFMVNTNTTIEKIIPWDITSMNTIKIFKGMTMFANENFKKTQLNENTGILKSFKKGFALSSLNIIFPTSYVYSCIHMSLGNQKPESSIQALSYVALLLQIQVDEVIINSSPETNSSRTQNQ